MSRISKTSVSTPRRGDHQDHDDYQMDSSIGVIEKRSKQSEDDAPIVLNALPIKPRPIWKAVFDYVAAVFALILFSPVLLALAIHVKLVSKGPVFFRHKRFGIGEKPFLVWKLRTMSTSADPKAHAEYVESLVHGNATLAKTSQNELIRFGKLIRDLGLDEVPQLFNVLAGQMSIVGPRPDVFEPTQLNDRQRVRYQVLPGITGLWQISGKNRTTFQEMIDMDVTYVEQRSLRLDLRIVTTTPRSILSQFLPGSKSAR